MARLLLKSSRKNNQTLPNKIPDSKAQFIFYMNYLAIKRSENTLKGLAAQIIQ